MSTLKLGTRGSPLALWQAHWVQAALEKNNFQVELVRIETSGDVKAGPIGQIGAQGVFTKEIQRALLSGDVDLAVHSLKDLPTESVQGLTLGAVPPRGPQFDAFVSNDYASFRDLPQQARVGTGSQRRRTQLLHLRPDLQLLEIRGNVDTRLRKLDDGEYDAIILAEAGLVRLNLAARVRHTLGPPEMQPAIGQGALGLEMREDDAGTSAALDTLNCPETHATVTAERALLAALRGGCLAPVGAWGRTENHQIQLDGVVLSGDGKTRLHASSSADCNNEAAVQLGQQVAQLLLDQGAERLIHDARAGELGGMRDED